MNLGRLAGRFFGEAAVGNFFRRPGWLVWLIALFGLGMLENGSAQILTHRYSFYNEPNGSLVATDRVATANGTLQGGAAVSGGKLGLNGASGSYVNLPGGLITGDTAVTIEAWADFGSLPQNCYLFSLGNTDGSGAGEDYIFCAPQAARITISGVDPGYNSEQNAAGQGWAGMTNLHVVAVFNPPAKTLSLYTNGVLAAINSSESVALSSVNDVYSYIGRSLYTADPYAPLNVDEFRIWNGAFNAQRAAIDAAAGPTQIVTSAGALQSIQLSVSGQMAAGATQQAVLTGDFANVANVNLFAYGAPGISSDNTNALIVSASGQLIARIPGVTANIIASYGGLTATQSVTIAGFVTNQFTFDSFGDGFWTLVNQGNGNVFAASPAGGTEEAFTNGATEQQFEVLYNLQNGSFRLRQRSSWNCLMPPAYAATNGAAVTPYPIYSGVKAQEWYLVDAGNGYYRVFNAASNVVLQTDNGTPAVVTLAPPANSVFQLWQFVYQTHYPKKGCAGYEGDYSPFELNWAYNYDDHTGVSLPAAVDFAPMIHDAYWEPMSDVQSRSAGWRAQAPPAYLLTYNEPDNSSQANMSTNQVISLWPQLQALNVPLVSPAMQNTFGAWAYNYFSLMAANHYRVDYVAAHMYQSPSASGLINNLQAVYNTWGKPVWLTEFSPVDWSGTSSWTEDDNYNFLAEFMWRAESLDWLKRYAVFPFSGSNPVNPWQSESSGGGYRANFFLSDGATLSPYGELYATWDGDLTLHARTPYIIHNLGTSFRLTDNGGSSLPAASSIYVRNATTEWGLLPAPEANHWYIISLNDGRRLRNNGGTLDLAPYGTTNATVDWWFNGPDSSGYYYLDNLAASQSVHAGGTAPAIALSMINDPAPSTATQWRLVKPYQPVTISTALPPVVSITYSNQMASLAWTGNGYYYNLYRGTHSGGPYTKLLGLTKNTSYVDYSVVNGQAYYYVVTALNILGDESAMTSEVVARPASTTAQVLNFTPAINGGDWQFSWAADHTGWRLEMNTNSLSDPSAWATIPNSAATNAVSVSWVQVSGNAFFRLVYP